jgi:hypothetical protein
VVGGRACVLGFYGSGSRGVRRIAAHQSLNRDEVIKILWPECGYEPSKSEQLKFSCSLLGTSFLEKTSKVDGAGRAPYDKRGVCSCGWAWANPFKSLQ